MMKTTLKKLFAPVFLFLLTICSNACGVQNASFADNPGEKAGVYKDSPPSQGSVEVVVFAAASLTETLEEVAVLYTAQNAGVRLVFNFDSSGTLKTQIQQGAACDLFISAGQKQVDQLDIYASIDVNTEGLDHITGGTRVNLLQNCVVLAVPEGNPKNISGFDDLAEKLTNGEVLLAMGNSNVPVGQYTQQILVYYGLSEEELAALGVISYGSNVKEVTTQIAEGSVDCGVIYRTDAFSAGLSVIDSATEDMCGKVIYPAAIIKGSRNAQAASSFLDFLSSDEAMRVFEKTGFVKP